MGKESKPLKTGDKYGKLTVYSRVENKGSRIYYLFVCDCGNEKALSKDLVVRGHTSSCGCLHDINCPSRTHGKSNTKTYRIWRGMMSRCNNPNVKAYKNYGGRGIMVCEEWHNYETFLKDMGERPEGKSLDRRDCNQGYYKENCRWASAEEQAQNKRKSKANTTGRTGVSYLAAQEKYSVEISTNGIHEYGGVFDNLIDAIAKREELELKYRGAIRPESYENVGGDNEGD
jgi:hypothetical protein